MQWAAAREQIARLRSTDQTAAEEPSQGTAENGRKPGDRDDGRSRRPAISRGGGSFVSMSQASRRSPSRRLQTSKGLLPQPPDTHANV